jgi:hypothetical protein
MLAHAWWIVAMAVTASLVLFGGAFLFVRPYWLRFQKTGRRFNYRITDIWASMLGLAPSMTAVTIFTNTIGQQMFHSKNDILMLLAIIGLTVFQIAGLAVGRIDIELTSSQPGECTAFESGVSIVTGALLGLIAFCGSFLVLGIVIGALGLL